MNTVEKIFEELQKLTEADAREVLDFVSFLKQKRMKSELTPFDVNELDRFGKVFKGKFNRDECYDRKVLR